MTKIKMPEKLLHTNWLRAGLGVALVAMIAFALMGTLSPTPTANAAGGDLDITFDADGKVTTADTGDGYAIVQQADGKIIMVGGSFSFGTVFSMVRYDLDGSLDTSFGVSGRVTTDFGTSTKATSIALQSDGKIVVAGTSGGDFAVARYKTDGGLDTSFSGDGVLTTNTDSLGGNFSTAAGNAVAIQSDGKIVVAGSIQNGSELQDFALVRYTSVGVLDTTFDGDGFVTTSFDSQQYDEIKAIAIQSDGKIVAVGDRRGGQFGLARYNSDGSLDTTFSGDGKVTATSVTPGYGVALQSDGKIVVTASKHVTDCTTANGVDSFGKKCQYEDFWVARYNSDGTLDSGFGAGGEAIIPINSRGNDDNGRSVAIQSDGKIVVAGYSDMAVHTFSNGGDTQNVSVTNDFSLARLNSDGSLDTSFSGDGLVTTEFFQTCGSNQCPTSDEAYSVLIQSDGKIVAAGTSPMASASTRHFALARYDENTVGTPTSYVVNSAADTDDSSCDALGTGSGNQDCTLREAITQANANIAADTITFDQSVFGSSGDITLGSSLPAINDDLTIDGTVNTSVWGVSVLGANLYQILTINSGKTVNLNQIYILNGAGSDGAGIANNGGTLNATKISVGNNIATSTGGGLSNNGGTVNVDNSQFYGNDASSSGGAIKNTGVLSVTSSYIGMNSAGFGGGIDNSGTMSLTNSTVYSNTAYGPGGLGGGIINYFGVMSVVNSTISDNNAYTPGFPTNGLGGGIDNGGTLDLRNSIVANSINGGDCAADGGPVTGSNNLIEDASSACGFANGVNGNIIGVDPNLGAPDYNGGQTTNMALMGGSPALDAGNDAVCAAAPVNGVDQRGVIRPQGPHCDIGAYEAEAASPTETPTSTATTIPTATETPTSTATTMPTATETPTATATPTGTATTPGDPTQTPTATATNTPTATATVPATNTPTATSTGTATPTGTATTPGDPTQTPTATATNTPTATATVPATNTPTATATNALVPTATATATATQPTSGSTVLQLFSITPNEGLNDQPVAVEIFGANFQSDPLFGSAPEVRLASYSLQNVILVSSNQLRATVPAGLSPGTYDLIVKNGPGDTVILASAYTVRTSQPAITQVQPSEGRADAPNDIGIYGFNFAAGAVVTLGDHVLESTFVDSHFIQASTPVTMTPGIYNITVRNPDNSEATGFNAYRSYETAGNDDLYANGYQIWTDPMAPRSQETAKVGVVIHRQGGKNTLPTVVTRFYVGDPDNGGLLLGEATILNFSIRSSNTTPAVNWTPPGPGSYTLYAVIDPDGNVSETVETNNVVSRTLTVLPPSPDTVAPRVADFGINKGTENEESTTSRTVTLSTVGEDQNPSSGLKSILYIEFEYNQNTAQWLPIQNSGWVDYASNREAYSWELAPSSGLKYMQSWVADNAGNISLFPYKDYINHTPPTERVRFDQGKIYRFTLKANQRLVARVIPSSGDPDLFIWPPDVNMPPWVSNLSDAVEELNILAPLDGVYQVEVYGYSNATFQLQVNITDNIGARSVSAVGGEDPNKDKPTQPLVALNSVPGDEQGLPTAPTIPVVEEKFNIYLPAVKK